MDPKDEFWLTLYNPINCFLSYFGKAALSHFASQVY